MKPNRSIPAATIIPVLIYPDVREAVVWLGAAFGFAERVRIGEDHRAQLSFGDTKPAPATTNDAATHPQRLPTHHGKDRCST